jgi:hypothetical protein
MIKQWKEEIMEIQIYISHLKDEEFDYNIGNPNGDRQYAPKPISSSVTIDNLYRDIVREVLDQRENTKKTDWGTFVIKLTNTDLIKFLSYEGYSSMNRLYRSLNKEPSGSLDIDTLLDCARKLADGEYLLVAQELG